MKEREGSGGKRGDKETREENGGKRGDGGKGGEWRMGRSANEGLNRLCREFNTKEAREKKLTREEGEK